MEKSQGVCCDHEKPPFGLPLCIHLRTCRESYINSVKWFVGRSLETEYICVQCAEARERGQIIDTALVCEDCFEHTTENMVDFIRFGGTPEVKSISIPFDNSIITTVVPSECNPIIEIASFDDDGRSSWLLLTEDGKLWRFNADTNEALLVGSTIFLKRPKSNNSSRRISKPRLLASHDGRFAAIVNDYDQYGQVIDLTTGKVTLELDGGTYHPDTVPFSIVFSVWRGNVVVIHRSDWNRLDISEAETGLLLTDRASPQYKKGEETAHYLNYFHGALHLSPGKTRILDDGWIWQPYGMPVTWSLERWLSDSVWESEDGSSRTVLCMRDDWDTGVAWLDESTVVIGGIGEVNLDLIDGARIFDVSASPSYDSVAQPHWQITGHEIFSFAGPSGRFYSDGKWLYSAGKNEMSRWNPKTGVRTGKIENFCPSYHHVSAGELVQLCDGKLLRWKLDDQSE